MIKQALIIGGILLVCSGASMGAFIPAPWCIFPAVILGYLGGKFIIEGIYSET